MKNTLFAGSLCSALLLASELSITAEPSITLNDPTGGVTLISPADFTLEAEAIASDGAVAEVEFLYLPYLQPPRSLGVVTTSPYRLEVASFTGTDGHIEAVVRDTVGGSASAVQPLRILGPAGDDIRRPIIVTGSDITIRTNNVAATKQYEEALRFNPAPERTLWWQWTAPGDGVLHCSTRGSTFDAQLILARVFDPLSWDLLALSRQVADYGYTRKVKLPVWSGTQYLIGVSALLATNQGLVTLHLTYEPVISEPAEPPPNDDRANHIPLVGPSVTATGSNLGATGAMGDPATGPAVLGGPWRSVWWSWTAPASGPYWISTGGSDFDTQLTIAWESQPGQLTPVLINDDETIDVSTSKVLLQGVQDQAYWIIVDGFGGHSGQIQLVIESLQGAPPPSNDDFGNRQVLEGPLALARGATYNATSESAEPVNSLSSSAAGSHTVWYSWQATQDGWAQALVKSPLRQATMGLNVHEGDALVSLNLVISGSRYGSPANQFARWHALAGHTYQIQINSSFDTDFSLGVDATLDEELPRLQVAGGQGTTSPNLELSSLRERRLQLLSSRDLISWEILADFRLEGTTNRVVEPMTGSAGEFFRAVAY